MLNAVLNEDCMDTFKRLKSDSFDAVITDPPYGTSRLAFDKEIFSEWMHEVRRVLKLNGWFFSFMPIEMAFQVIQSGFRLKFDYVWVKQNITMKTKETVAPFKKHEHVFAFVRDDLKKPCTLYFDPKALRTSGEPYRRKAASHIQRGVFRKTPDNPKKNDSVNDGFREGTSVLFFNNKAGMRATERTPHPTQKPLELVKMLCTGYCPKYGTILDPFAGSGTTSVAAKLTGRNCISIEKNPEWYNVAYHRVQST